MVEAAHLPLRVEVAGSCGLRFDDGGELVGDVIHPGAVREVDEGAGREAVAAERRAPGETQDGHSRTWSDQKLMGAAV